MYVVCVFVYIAPLFVKGFSSLNSQLIVRDQTNISSQRITVFPTEGVIINQDGRTEEEINNRIESRIISSILNSKFLSKN
jgi:hypothetical protein